VFECRRRAHDRQKETWRNESQGKTRSYREGHARGELASYEGMIPKDSDWKQGLTYRQGRQKAA